MRESIERFNLQHLKPKHTPMPTGTVLEAPDPDLLLDAKEQRLFMAKLGVLNYLSTQCRPDIAVATSKLGSFMQQADSTHMALADRVFAYLLATPDVGLTYRRTGRREIALLHTPMLHGGTRGLLAMAVDGRTLASAC